ncbi:hypothetical protein G7083_05415 [Vibrio sp. HDW18]|uniref:hypothetical protein n=1 Tax=Vibrio TaxID=662 RepID=UPI001409BA63|nr:MULTISPECIES: hypothetical protein [unclassified Vibrio]QIL85374.1 hypothetical protein G7083_05415 [Vibrio sp. HDW18]
MLKNENQKKLMLISVILNSLCAVIFMPIITRSYGADDLSIITTVIFIGVMFGMIDSVRPVYVHGFSSLSFISVKDVFFYPLFFNLILSLALFFFVYTLNIFSNTDCFFIFISAFLYLTSMPFLGFLDSKGMVGFSSLLRAVSVFIIYFQYSVVNYFNFVSIPLVVSNVVFLFFSIFACFRFLKNGKSDFNYSVFKRIIKTFGQNVFKLIIDFTDRLFVAKFVGGDFVGVYNAIYELSSKSNFISSVYSSYNYPQLCLKKIREVRFVSTGNCISLFLLILSVLCWFFGDIFMSFYLGEGFSNTGSDVAIMLSISAIYSLSFFYQSIFRANDRFGELTKLFSFSAILGLTLIFPLYTGLGIKGIYISLFILKSPGAICSFFYSASNGNTLFNISSKMLPLIITSIFFHFVVSYG